MGLWPVAQRCLAPRLGPDEVIHQHHLLLTVEHVAEVDKSLLPAATRLRSTQLGPDATASPWRIGVPQHARTMTTIDDP